MEFLEARYLNQLFFGKRIYVSRYQDGSGRIIKEPFIGRLRRCMQMRDKRVFIELEIDTDRFRVVYLPPDWDLRIDVKGGRYGEL